MMEVKTTELSASLEKLKRYFAKDTTKRRIRTCLQKAADRMRGYAA